MSISIGAMHEHLLRIVAVAHLAKASQEAAERALSDVVAETHHRDFDTHIDVLIQLICGEAGRPILVATVDEMQAVIADLGDDDPAAQVSA